MRQMVVKKVLTVVALALFAGAPALADTIDFNATGSGGKWSFSGSGPLSLTANFVEVDVNNGPYTLLGSSASLTFETGAFLSGSAMGPWSWGPSAANSIVIEGCIPPASAGCTNVILFSGQSTSSDMFLSSGSSSGVSLAFNGLGITGTLNSSLAAFLGEPGGAYSGAVLTFNLTGKHLTGGEVQSGDLTLTSSVPEPASLVFLGIGLVGLAGLTRLKRGQSQA